MDKVSAMTGGVLPCRKLLFLASAIALVLCGFFIALQMTSHGIEHYTGIFDEDLVTRNAVHPKHKHKVYKDNVDDSGASRYLTQYKDLFSAGKESNADPQQPKTITKWWEAAAMIDWYINSPLRYTCGNIVSYGNWHVCQDKGYTVKAPCLVYSFGISNDFSFDDDMAKIGCEVHSFDPSMKKPDHKRGEHITFHNMGLGSINTDGFQARKDVYVKDDQKWKIRTLKTIMQELGHEGMVLDVLKIDVEGHEWSVVDNFLETGVLDVVRHFSLEFHLFPEWPVRDDFVYAYNVYRRLRESGFREYLVNPHPKTLEDKTFNNQGDSEFVNVFFDEKRLQRQ